MQMHPDAVLGAGQHLGVCARHVSCLLPAAEAPQRELQCCCQRVEGLDFCDWQLAQLSCLLRWWVLFSVQEVRKGLWRKSCPAEARLKAGGSAGAPQSWAAAAEPERADESGPQKSGGVLMCASKAAALWPASAAAKAVRLAAWPVSYLDAACASS